MTTPAMDKLLDVIEQFYSETGVTLHINDMSLSSGGVFDICSDWQNPHFYHRTGTSVDLDDIFSPEGLAHLTRIMKANHFERYREGPIHFEYIGP